MFKKNRGNEVRQAQYRTAKSYSEMTKYRGRPERDTDCNQQSFVSVSPSLNKAEQLTVYEAEDYLKIEGVLTKKLQMILDSINISQEKNKLKDKEIQIIAQSIDKVIDKISSLEAKVSSKQKRLSKISLKCHDKTSQTTKDQQKIRKQSTILNEQTITCESLGNDIHYLEEKYRTAQRQLQNCKKLCNSLDSIQSQNQQLRQQLSQLQNEEKMIEYLQNNQKLECEQLQNKLEELKIVYKERSKINKRNMIKLNTLKKEMSGRQGHQNLMGKKVDEIKNLELEFGELNQQLVLFNQDIADFDFKIRKKEKNIADMKSKLRVEKYEPNLINYRRKETHKIIESQDEISRTENDSSKTSKKNSIGKNQELSINSKNVSPMRNRSNLTPTFPSNELQGMPETSSKQMKSVEEVPSQAFKNIQKLINRFQQIKNKEKSKN